MSGKKNAWSTTQRSMISECESFNDGNRRQTVQEIRRIRHSSQDAKATQTREELRSALEREKWLYQQQYRMKMEEESAGNCCRHNCKMGHERPRRLSQTQHNECERRKQGRRYLGQQRQSGCDSPRPRQKCSVTEVYPEGGEMRKQVGREKVLGNSSPARWEHFVLHQNQLPGEYHQSAFGRTHYQRPCPPSPGMNLQRVFHVSVPQPHLDLKSRHPGEMKEEWKQLYPQESTMKLQRGEKKRERMFRTRVRRTPPSKAAQGWRRVYVHAVRDSTLNNNRGLIVMGSGGPEFYTRSNYSELSIMIGKPVPPELSPRDETRVGTDAAIGQQEENRTIPTDPKFFINLSKPDDGGKEKLNFADREVPTRTSPTERGDANSMTLDAVARVKDSTEPSRNSTLRGRNYAKSMNNAFEHQKKPAVLDNQTKVDKEQFRSPREVCKILESDGRKTPKESLRHEVKNDASIQQSNSTAAMKMTIENNQNSKNEECTSEVHPEVVKESPKKNSEGSTESDDDESQVDHLSIMDSEENQHGQCVNEASDRGGEERRRKKRKTKEDRMTKKFLNTVAYLNKLERKSLRKENLKQYKELCVDGGSGKIDRKSVKLTCMAAADSSNSTSDRRRLRKKLSAESRSKILWDALPSLAAQNKGNPFEHLREYVRERLEKQAVDQEDPNVQGGVKEVRKTLTNVPIAKDTKPAEVITLESGFVASCSSPSDGLSMEDASSTDLSDLDDGDDPKYLKHLRSMRRDHMSNIIQEVKRLNEIIRLFHNGRG